MGVVWWVVVVARVGHRVENVRDPIPRMNLRSQPPATGRARVAGTEPVPARSSRYPANAAARTRRASGSVRPGWPGVPVHDGAAPGVLVSSEELAPGTCARERRREVMSRWGFDAS
ncbi:hypothetical protein RW1_009_01890 [Rhodococcus wratislaviensis NBRC 100605]|uniref:Uncharacterized protein n=1 Tax=Rhodococcus wratislaviensis NBRC 100605 TaxID=1219028 RepID=X0PMH8_RHOWR|nr:hypothetical protein RW1_009_01890 [Rhodococcus wratislaviensis NBRC 100605]